MATIVETTKIAAVHGGSHLHSVVSANNVDNGMLGFIQFNGDDNMEIKNFVTYANADDIAANKAVLVANPEWDYSGNRENDRLDNYVNVSNVPFRVYDLIEGDIYGVSIDGFVNNTVFADATEADKTLVVLDATTGKLKKAASNATVASLDEANAFIGIYRGSKARGTGIVVIDGEDQSVNYTMYYVEVLKNDGVKVPKASS